MKYFLLQNLNSPWSFYHFYLEENIKALHQSGHEVFLLSADINQKTLVKNIHNTHTEVVFSPKEWSPYKMRTLEQLPYSFARITDHLIEKGHFPDAIEYPDYEGLGYFIEIEKQLPYDLKFHCKSICTWYGSHLIRHYDDISNSILEEMESFVYESADIHFAIHHSILTETKKSLEIQNTKPINLKPAITYDFPWKNIQINLNSINIVISKYVPEQLDILASQIKDILTNERIAIEVQIIPHKNNLKTVSYLNHLKSDQGVNIDLKIIQSPQIRPRSSSLYYFPFSELNQLDYKLYLMSKGQMVLENQQETYNIWPADSKYHTHFNTPNLLQIIQQLPHEEYKDWVKESLFELHQEYRADRNVKMKSSILKAIEDHHKSTHFPSSMDKKSHLLRPPQIKYNKGTCLIIHLHQKHYSLEEQKNITQLLKYPSKEINEVILLQSAEANLNWLIPHYDTSIPCIPITYTSANNSIKWIELIDLVSSQQLLYIQDTCQIYPSFFFKSSSIFNQYQNISSISSWGIFQNDIDFSTSPKTPYLFVDQQTIPPFFKIDLNKMVNGSHLHLQVNDIWFYRHYLLQQLQQGWKHFVIPEILFECKKELEKIDFTEFDLRNFPEFTKKYTATFRHLKLNNIKANKLYFNHKPKQKINSTFESVMDKIKKIKKYLSLDFEIKRKE